MRLYIVTKEEEKAWDAGFEGIQNPYPSDKGLAEIYEDAKECRVECERERVWHRRNGAYL